MYSCIYDVAMIYYCYALIQRELSCKQFRKISEIYNCFKNMQNVKLFFIFVPKLYFIKLILYKVTLFMKKFLH